MSAVEGASPIAAEDNYTRRTDNHNRETSDEHKKSGLSSLVVVANQTTMNYRLLPNKENSAPQTS